MSWRLMFRQPALPYFHPATLIATWFWSGLLRPASGTWGSLAALPFGIGIFWLGGPWLLGAATILAFVAGLWASDRYASAIQQSDPSDVVIDEVVGQWIAILPFALDPVAYGLAFFTFRFFDIVKPWPANWCDQRLKGALGIMADDVFAGLYAAIFSYWALVAARELDLFPWI